MARAPRKLGYLANPARSLPMLKRAARGRALVVVPLFGKAGADTAQVTVVIDEPCIALRAPRHRPVSERVTRSLFESFLDEQNANRGVIYG